MTLDEWFIIAKQNQNVLYKIMKEHGGLAHWLGKRFGKRLEPFESLSYMWEALPIAIQEWDPEKGSAASAITLVFCRLMSRRNEQNTRIGSVRIPPRRINAYTQIRLSLFDNAEETICEGLEYSDRMSEV